MHVKKFLSLIIFFVLSYSTVFAKPLPPGAGNAVPVNILFLIDKSNSMFKPANGDDSKTAWIRGAANDVVGKQNGKYFVGMTSNFGISYWDPLTDRWYMSDGTFKNEGVSLDDRKFETDYIKGIDYYNGYIYAVIDRDHSGCPGSALMSIRADRNDDSRFFRKKRADTGTYNCSKKPPKDTAGNSALIFNTVGAMSINQSAAKLWYVTRDAWYVFNGLSGHFAKSPNYTICSTSSTIRSYFDDAIDVVSIGTDRYIFGKDGPTGKLYKMKLNSSGCPTGSVMYVNQVDTECGQGKGDSIHYSNGFIYTSGYYRHKICKYRDNGNSVTAVKSVGVSDGYKTNSTSSTDINLYYPMGLDSGNGNTTDQEYLYIANSERLEVTVLKKSDLTFVRDFGNEGVSRITGAKDALRSVFEDSAILTQANFGLGMWNKGTGYFKGFNRTGSSYRFDSPYNPDEEAYMAVGINPKGAEQIIQFFSKDVELNFGTHATGFSNLARTYFNYSVQAVNPYNKNLDCQTNSIIVIGDGEWSVGHSTAVSEIKALYSQKKIQTYTVGYGSDVVGNTSAENNFKAIAVAGGTQGGGKEGYYNALTPQDLKTVVDQIVREIISRSTSYSAPSISAEVLSEGELYQSKFQNRNTQEWWGTLIKTELTDTGDALSGTTTAGKGFKWDAAKIMKDPSQRKLWTALPGSDYRGNWNNFNESNVSEIRGLFQKTGNVIREYHRRTSDSSNPVNLTRCFNSKGIGLDGTVNDEDKGLINFIRGHDYFDYDGDCNITEYRTREEITKSSSVFKAYVADIYNSELVTVGVPSATRTSEKTNTEAYFRGLKNYSVWADNNTPRRELIFAAANNGVLHAFATDTGEEIWGFIPPLVIPKIPKIINGNYNQSGKGGSNPLFLLDGSITVHDTFFKHPIHNKEDWYTVLMAPYGRGGAGFAVLDVTKPTEPLHLYSVLNDPVSEKVYHADAFGNISEYSYQTTRVSIEDFVQTKDAITNKISGLTNDCDNTSNTSCYTGNKWTLRGISINKSNASIIADGIDVTSSTNVQLLNGDSILTFSKDYTYDALVDSKTNPTPNSTITISEVGNIAPGGEDYDYRFLGETWSSPRVFRMPNNGAGDNDVSDDQYVAVLTGGYGYPFPKIGSNVFIIDWTNGKIVKTIEILDKGYTSTDPNDIPNSTPSTPVVITPDLSNAPYSGALVYVNDLEGKITKINLTNMQYEHEYDPTDDVLSVKTDLINLYDKTTLFDAQASKTFNNRLMYHPMDVGIGARSNKLWLFGGTGDYLNLNDIMINSSSVKNIMYGIKDVHFPYFGHVNDPLQADKLTKCKNTTTDSTGAECPESGDLGWYIELDDNKKVVAEPTIKGNIVYYPIFKPADKNTVSCGSGYAYICAVDADCGTNISHKFPSNKNSQQGEECYYVGTGVLSKIVAHGNKLYVNISGKTPTNPDKDDLVVIEALSSEIENYRNSWRENF